MAKKSNRIMVGLVCTVCGSFNYISERNKVNTNEKLTVKKYCPHCRRRTIHKETQKFK